MASDDHVEYVPMIRDMPRMERPRERFMQVGPRAMSTTELLAITLRTGVGGENVLRLAERLLANFNGLSGLAQATIRELMTVKGIGPAKAVEVKAALELGRRLLAAAPEERPRVTSPGDAANLLMTEMMLLEQEQLRVILLDTRNHVLDVETVYKGSLNTSVVRVSELFRAAIKSNAAAIIVAHNHPSGCAKKAYLCNVTKSDLLRSVAVATRACDMAQDPIWCEASPTTWRQSSLQTLGAASQRLAMATNRNRCLKRHRLEHPPMAGQGAVTGQPYSEGKGCGSDGQISGTPHTTNPSDESVKETGTGVQTEPKASRRRYRYELGNHVWLSYGSRCL